MVSKIQEWQISSLNGWPFAQIKFIYLKKKRLRKPLTVIKDGFVEMEQFFRLEHLEQKNVAFSEILLLTEICHWSDRKSHVPFHFAFQLDFLETFCSW